MAVNIIINNNKCKLICKASTLVNLKEHFKIRHPGAFHIRMHSGRQWDGYVHPITDAGYFATGLLPRVHEYLTSQGKKIGYEDEREPLKIYPLKSIKGYEDRQHQVDAIQTLLTNKVGELPFMRGIIGAATNFGKTLLCAMVYNSFKQKTILYFNSKEIFQEAFDELPKMLKGKVGWISAEHGIEWNEVMVCMVQTINSRWDQLKHKLGQYQVVIVDECDLSGSRSYRNVMAYTINAPVRVGMSGSALVSKLAKDRLKNQKLIEIYGEKIYEMKNRELIDKGFSSDVEITIISGNTSVKIKGDFQAEYEEGIVGNKERNQAVVDRVKYHLEQKHYPLLVIAQRKKHVRRLHRLIKAAIDPVYLTNYVHHTRKNRRTIISRFKDGDLEVLVGSMILKRAKNFPMMRYLLNAAGGDSQATVLQILGRATRKHKSKKLTYMEDFWDEGHYLRRHSYHRLKTYKNEKLTVIEQYKSKKHA